MAIKGEQQGIEYWAEVAEPLGLALVKVNVNLSWRTFEAMLAHAAGEHVGIVDYLSGTPIDQLSGIVNDLARHVGGSVVVEDLGRRPIVHSTVQGQLIDELRKETILSRSTPASPQDSEQYQAVLQASDAILQPKLFDEALRAAIAVRAGTRPLGSIWAILPENPGAAWDEIAIRMSTAASRSAGLMLDLLRSSEMGMKDRAQRLRRILRATSVSETDLTELGLRTARGISFVAIEATQQPQPGELDACRAIVQQQLGLLHGEALTAIEDSSIVALIEGPSSDTVVASAESVQALLRHSLGVQTRVVVSEPVRAASEVAVQRRLVDRMLVAARQHPRSRPVPVYTAASMRNQLLLASIAETLATDPELFLPDVVALVASDPETAQSLLVWIRSGRNVSHAAGQLQVHKNTVRYRLRKAQETYGLDLDDPDEVLSIWLQLRLMLEKPATPDRLGLSPV